MSASKQPAAEKPPLHGLVLAGGRSSRMGRDKGTLLYVGEPQVLRAYQLLTEFCARVYVSIRPEQQKMAPYSALPYVLDDGEIEGPAAGLTAAWERDCDSALYVLAADMPFVDRRTLRRLADARDPAAYATAYRHTDGVPEPLCTIWEPAAGVALKQRLVDGRWSLRRMLEESAVRYVDPAPPGRLQSVNSPDDYARALESLHTDVR